MALKTLLVGEPMGLFIAQTEGPLESVKLFSTAVAGAEFNVAVGLVRLGHAVEYMTSLGNDPFGKQILHAMHENNIETHLITIHNQYPTGFMLKSKVSSGDPEIYYRRKGSAASYLSNDDIERIDFSQFRCLHVTGIFPALSPTTLEATRCLVRKAKANHLTIFFDPNLRPQLWENKTKMIATINELALSVDYFLPGIKEGAILTGFSDPERIAGFYKERGVPNIIIKTGPLGAYVAAKTESGNIPAYKVDKIVDTVGAGDGFAAGVISAVIEGLPIMDAVRRGNAIGAIQLLSIGDNDGLPTRDEMEKFMSGGFL